MWNPSSGRMPAPARIDPVDLGVVAAFGHRKDAHRIGAQQHLRGQRSGRRHAKGASPNLRGPPLSGASVVQANCVASHFSSQWML